MIFFLQLCYKYETVSNVYKKKKRTSNAFDVQLAKNTNKIQNM